MFHHFAKVFHLYGILRNMHGWGGVCKQEPPPLVYLETCMGEVGHANKTTPPLVYLETCMGGVGYANKTTPPLEAAEACLDME